MKSSGDKIVLMGSKSGRVPSSNPNMSQHPKDPEVAAMREAFVHGKRLTGDEKLEADFSAAVVLTTITGIVVSAKSVKVGKVLECAEWILGRPVLIHELGRTMLYEVMFNLVRKQYEDIPTMVTVFNDPNQALQNTISRYGPILSIKRRVRK